MDEINETNEPSPFTADYDADPPAQNVVKAKPDLRAKASYTPNPTRLLPQAPDAEKGSLSAFFRSPREVGGICAEKRVTIDWYFSPAHQLIFDCMFRRWDRNEAIDEILVTQDLRDAGTLNQCGGAAYISELGYYLPTAANIEEHLDKLDEKRQAREVITVGAEFSSRGYEAGDQIAATVDQFEKRVMEIRRISAQGTQHTPKQLVVSAISIIEQAYSNRGQVSGLPTGFTGIDQLLDGLHPNDMVVIAARPSMGKTALAMNMAEYIAVELRKPVGVFSLEMTAQQLMTRMLCARARVNLARVRDGFLSERDFPAIQTAASKLSESKMFIDDASGLNIGDIRARARRLKQQHDIQVLFIDYLQLVRSLTKRAQDSRAVEVAEASAGVKGLAKELGIPIVVLCQLGRDFEKRGPTARPRLSDLRESGAIEQDADVIGFLVREEFYAESDEEKKRLQGRAELIIGKQRNGPVGDVPLTFLKEYTRFEDRAVCDEEPVEQDQKQMFTTDPREGREDPRRGKRH